MSNIPADLRYAKSHEWVRLEGEQGTVGISDHAQQELTDIVYVELATAALYLDDPAEAELYSAALDRLAIQAEFPAATTTFLKKKLSETA